MQASTFNLASRTHTTADPLASTCRINTKFRRAYSRLTTLATRDLAIVCVQLGSLDSNLSLSRTADSLAAGYPAINPSFGCPNREFQASIVHIYKPQHVNQLSSHTSSIHQHAYSINLETTSKVQPSSSSPHQVISNSTTLLVTAQNSLALLWRGVL